MVKCSDFIRFGSKFQETLIFPDAKRFSSRTRLVGQRHAGNWEVQLPEAMHDQKLSFGEEIDCTILTSEESNKFWTVDVGDLARRLQSGHSQWHPDQCRQHFSNSLRSFLVPMHLEIRKQKKVLWPICNRF